MAYSGKHRKTGIWSRLGRKHSNLYTRLENLPKAVIWHETDTYVHFMPRHTEEYILPDYCAN